MGVTQATGAQNWWAVAWGAADWSGLTEAVKAWSQWAATLGAADQFGLVLKPAGESGTDASSTFRCIFCLLMCLPPLDASSAFRCVFRFATRLPPPDLSPAPPPTMVTSSTCLLTASPGCRDFHRHPATFHNVLPGPLSIPLGIHCTATSSAVPLHIPATPLAC